MDPIPAQTKIDSLVGASLMTAPLWAYILQDISLIASAITMLCGAVLGVHSVYQIIKRYRTPPEPWDGDF